MEWRVDNAAETPDGQERANRVSGLSLSENWQSQRN
jgi:hypothetical protein